MIENREAIQSELDEIMSYYTLYQESQNIQDSENKQIELES